MFYFVASAGVVSKNNVDVAYCLWRNPTASGTLIITDRAGNTFTRSAVVGADTLVWPTSVVLGGFTVTALPSGTLEISMVEL